MRARTDDDRGYAASETSPSTARPSRWPWVVFASFVAIAVVGIVLVSANGESISEQLPFVVAFSMFGVVGALIVSRERHNVIGSPPPVRVVHDRAVVLGRELFSWLVSQGSVGTLAPVMGLFSSFGWLFGILPVLFLLPLLFPDGRLPSSRWTVPVVHLRDPHRHVRRARVR